MTLLVGILATDGAVVASDRAVTFGSERLHTIADSHQKVQIVQDKVIVVGTGQVGMGQRFKHIVEASVAKSEFFTVPPVQVGRFLAQQAHQDFANTGARQGTFGALVAYANDHAQMIEFAVSDMQPEHKAADNWYVSMGSGQTLADPYLALMRRAVWAAGQPSIGEATYTAYWVMRQAILAAPGLIAEPIDMAVLRKNEKGDFEARLLPPSEIDEHRNRAIEANEQLKQALLGLLEPMQSVPPMPEPEPAKS